MRQKEETIYVSVKEQCQVTTDNVHLKDVASLYTENATLKNRLQSEVVFRFEKGKETRQVISALYILQLISQKTKQECNIQCITASDCVLERISEKKSKSEVCFEVFKITFICLLCMIGGAFSIMAFHNDVGLNHIFMKVYELITGEKSSGFTVLEISYSIGLMSGIVIFYDHIGKRRITKDPTPIEVSMREYEKQMNQALTSSIKREGKTIDVS